MRTIILLSLTLLAFSNTSIGQKVAHADINAILSVMPENKKINEDLKIYATGLSKIVGDKKAQLDMVIDQFNQTLSAGDTAKAVELQQKGLALDKEVQQANASADQQLQAKRNELMQPVLKRIREAMEKVASSKGFETVLNSVDGSGTSIVLWALEGSDITREVVTELGIELETSGENNDEIKPSGKEKKKKK